MDRYDTTVTWGLIAAGVLSLFLGIGSIGYGILGIKPHLEQLSDQAVEGIEMAERGLEALDTHSNAIGPLNPSRSNTLATMQELPSALEQSANLSRHAAVALGRSATTLREIEDDLGIVLPNDALQQNAEALGAFARSLRGLSPMLDRLHEEVDTVAADLTRTSQRAERLQDELQDANVTIGHARSQVERARETLQSANLPAEVTRLIALVGGIFIVMGIILLGLAGLWRRMVRLSIQNEQSSPSRPS